MATVLACVLLASGIWLGGSSTATLNLVKRSRGKGKLSFLDEEREGRRGRHVEERTRITGERIKDYTLEGFLAPKIYLNMRVT